MPMSTIVPIAIAIPDKATTLASTRNSFIPIKAKRTARGRIPEIKAALRLDCTLASQVKQEIVVGTLSQIHDLPSMFELQPGILLVQTEVKHEFELFEMLF